jgi:hypothetical protein
MVGWAFEGRFSDGRRCKKPDRDDATYGEFYEQQTMPFTYLHVPVASRNN